MNSILNILKDTIDVLRIRFKSNLEIIKENNKNVKDIIKNEKSTNQRGYNISNRHNLSKNIILENKDNLELQNNILNFISKYKDNMSFKEKLYEIKNWEKSLIENDKENIPENNKNENINKNLDCNDIEIYKEKLNNIIQGKEIFNDKHPCFNHNDFFDDVLSYYIEIEEYIMCDKLIKLKK